jgi:hypothetical protein
VAGVFAAFLGAGGVGRGATVFGRIACLSTSFPGSRAFAGSGHWLDYFIYRPVHDLFNYLSAVSESSSQPAGGICEKRCRRKGAGADMFWWGDREKVPKWLRTKSVRCADLNPCPLIPAGRVHLVKFPQFLIQERKFFL